MMALDKDILIKGNKIYSPETCVFVARSINNLFVKCDASRGDLPIGVSLLKSTGRYRARYNKFDNGKQKEIHIGYFDTPVQAFNAYKQEKEKHIKEVAEQYKDKIPLKLYDAMYAYKVEMTD